MAKTKYELLWTDFLMFESVLNMLKEHSDIEISSNDNEVVEIKGKHTFEAESDEKAKEYADEYHFGGYDGVCYDLFKGDELIATEEDE